MKTLKIALLGICMLFVASCEERFPSRQATDQAEERQGAVGTKPLIRYISFFGSDSDYGVELNGTRGFLRREDANNKRLEIPFEEASSLIEGFYAISELKRYRGKESDDRQSSIHYLVMVYDESKGRHNEGFVDYVIPKNVVIPGTDLHRWLKNMDELRDKE